MLLLATGCADDGGTAEAALTAEDDAVSVYAGFDANANLVENDAGPDGTTPRVCDVASGRADRLRLRYFETAENLIVVARPGARPGTHDIAYTVCAQGERQTATIRVTVLPQPTVTVTRVAQPGRIRVTNSADVPISLEYDHPLDEAGGPDGQVRVPAGGTRVFTVRRYAISWSASDETDGPHFYAHGVTKGITLPEGVEPLPDPRAPGST